MARLLRRWFALPLSDQWRLLQLGLMLPVVAGLLRMLGMMGCARLMQQSNRRRLTHPATAPEIQYAQRLAELAAIAGRRSAIRTTCLRQALLLQWLLRRRGLDAQLRIGVRKNNAALDAHAWVELDGVALGEPDLAHAKFPDDLAVRASQMDISRH
ncbi:MAG: lasso peptide biosynthesis B2 protein [Lysobacteraceae bacterium]